MGGKLINSEKVEMSISNWSNPILNNIVSWEESHLHINEIEGLKNIVRKEWIDTTLKIIKILNSKFILSNSLLPFFNIGLKYSKKILPMNTITIDWLVKNICYTPPSLHYCTEEYFNIFYLNEFEEVEFKDIYYKTSDLAFYFRFFYDDLDKSYSREIYIFPKLKN